MVVVVGGWHWVSLVVWKKYINKFRVSTLKGIKVVTDVAQVEDWVRLFGQTLVLSPPRHQEKC